MAVCHRRSTSRRSATSAPTGSPASVGVAGSPDRPPLVEQVGDPAEHLEHGLAAHLGRVGGEHRADLQLAQDALHLLRPAARPPAGGRGRAATCPPRARLAGRRRWWRRRARGARPRRCWPAARSRRRRGSRGAARRCRRAAARRRARRSARRRPGARGPRSGAPARSRSKTSGPASSRTTSPSRRPRRRMSSPTAPSRSVGGIAGSVGAGGPRATAGRNTPSGFRQSRRRRIDVESPRPRTRGRRPDAGQPGAGRVSLDRPRRRDRRGHGWDRSSGC